MSLCSRVLLSLVERRESDWFRYLHATVWTGLNLTSSFQTARTQVTVLRGARSSRSCEGS